jgi:hypothetical protein
MEPHLSSAMKECRDGGGGHLKISFSGAGPQRHFSIELRICLYRVIQSYNTTVKEIVGEIMWSRKYNFFFQVRHR